MSQANQTFDTSLTRLSDSDLTTKRKRILLVEGDGFTRLVLLLRLRLAGFAVDFTSNGILGLQKLRSCHPDILLVDLKLCGMSGMDLIKAARADTRFGKRPIYVFTYADHMKRATRKEVGTLATKVFDKAAISREELVQIFAETFLASESAAEGAGAKAGSAKTGAGDMLPPGAIEEIVAGVREQTKLVGKRSEVNARLTECGELLSRVRSLASCADATGLLDLSRQAKALESFLGELCKEKKDCDDAALMTVNRAVDVMGLLSPAPSGDKQNLTPFSAVLVDESGLSRQALEKALLDFDFGPTSFGDPAQARQHLASHPADLIVVNVALPEAHGLSLKAVRQLPLHSRTPVLFVPESHSKLHSEHLFRKELVLKALTDVQNAPAQGLTYAVSSAPDAPAPAPAPPPPTPPPVTPNVAQVVPAFGDGFELFAPKRVQEDRVVHPAEPPVGAGSDWTYARPAAAAVSLPPDTKTAEEHTRPLNAFMTGAEAPAESPADVEPAVPEPEAQAQEVTIQPETYMDAHQIDDRPVEVLQPSGLQVESTELQQAEPAPEDLYAEPEPFGSPSEAGSPEQEEVASEYPVQEPLEAAAGAEVYAEAAGPEQELAASDPVPAEYEEQPEAALAAETPAETPAEPSPAPHEELVARIYSAETELFGARAQIERKDKAIAALQAKVQEIQAENQDTQMLMRNAAEGEAAKARCDDLERQLAELQTARQQDQQAMADLQTAREQDQQALAELRVKLKDLEQAQAEGGGAAQIAELEHQVRQSVAALTRATADLAKERGERQRSEQRATNLSARMQELHHDLSRTLEGQRADLERITALEGKLHQAEQDLARRAADVEQHQAEAGIAEEELRKTKELNAQLRKNLTFFEEANKKLEQNRQELQAKLETSLNAARERDASLYHEGAEGQRLAEAREVFQREIQEQTRKREILEGELRAAQQALRESDTRLQKETAERQRLNEALESAQLNLRERSEQGEMELARLRSALQHEELERQRQEALLARVRQASAGGFRAARSLRHSLRRQVREPIDNLYQSARSLLQLELGEEQKKLAEAVLQDALLVQTRLREPELPYGDSAESAQPNSSAA